MALKILNIVAYPRIRIQQIAIVIVPTVLVTGVIYRGSLPLTHITLFPYNRHFPEKTERQFHVKPIV
jgi:hypothetical protein